jgi:hypothetical protein
MSDNEKRLLESLMGFSNAHSILLERCKSLKRDFDSAVSYGDIVDDGMDTAAELLSCFLEDVLLLENEE